MLYRIALLFACYLLSCKGCVTPPLECPNENVTFWLYTRANQDNPHELKAIDNTTINSGPWIKGAPIKILIHGYTGHKDFQPSSDIRPAYMQCCDYNIISVDYNPIALDPCYLQAAQNTELVGKCTAQLIDKLVEHGMLLKRFHIIGFSLGAHVAGHIANYLISGRLPRITGLDPAMPLFVTGDDKKKLDKTDADFVDIAHTNSLEKGKLELSGHVDFYPNGGMKQPGCDPNAEYSCDHGRAPVLFAESITTKVGFYATKCYSWITYMIGWCEVTNSSEEILFGEYVSYNVSGSYFFLTNSESPFARGKSKRNRRYTNLTEEDLIDSSIEE